MALLPVSFDASQYPQEDSQRLNSDPEPVNPFDGMFQEQQSTNDAWNAQAAQSAPTRSRHVTCHLDAEGKLVIDDIPNGYTQEEREILEHWYPELYGQPSEHALNSHKVVLTGEDVLAHTRVMFKEQEKAEAAKRKAEKEQTSAKQEEFANSHMEWIAQCGHRKQAIESAKIELTRRKLQRKTALAQFNAQWEAYENEANLALQEANALPVPARPAKA